MAIYVARRMNIWAVTRTPDWLFSGQVISCELRESCFEQLNLDFVHPKAIPRAKLLSLKLEI